MRPNKSRPIAPLDVVAAASVLMAAIACGFLPSGSASLKLLLSSILLLPAAVLFLARSDRFARRNLGIIGCIALGGAWLGWGFMQTVNLPEPVLRLIAPGSERVYQTFVDPSINAISSASVRLGDADRAIVSRHSISLIPEQSIQTLAKYALALALFASSALVFRNRDLRKTLLWTLAVTSTLLAFWGLIQRGSGTTNLLPFVNNPLETTPFGTYAYKNAGAAAIIPGIAAAIAIILSRIPRGSSRATATDEPSRPFSVIGVDGPKSGGTKGSIAKRGSEGGYFRRSWLTQPQLLALLAMLALMLCGLLASLSRGAVLSAGVAFLCVAVLPPINRMIHRLAFVGVIMVLACAGVAAITNLSSIVAQRSEKWQIDALNSDMRWQHWKTCVATIANHMPTGVGIGAYGYASLTQQADPTRLWFREAHNQYLETCAEMGVPGILILSALLVLASRWTIRLLKNPVSRELNGLGVAGTILLLAGGIQSLFDFVLVISGVMFLYAIFFGAIAAAAVMAKVESTSQDPSRKRIAFRFHPVASVRAVALGMTVILAMSAYQCVAELRRETILESTLITAALVDMPRQSEIDDALRCLDKSIDSGNSDAAILRRRAMWNLVAYRRELIREAAAQKLQITWEATTPENLFRILQSAGADDRDEIVKDFTNTPRMKALLCATLNDLTSSMIKNPLVPQTHLCCAFLSPITGMPWELWSTNSRRLSLSSPDLLFANGLMGYYAGDHELMLAQWSRSLQVSNNNLKPIIELSQNVLTADEMAEQLMPTNRLGLWVTTIRFKGRPFVPRLNLNITPELVQTAIRRICDADHLSEFQRHEMAGQIYVASENWDSAAMEWRLAVRCDGRHVESRYQLASVLYKLGQYGEAIQHCETGTLLNPYDRRFAQLAVQLKRVSTHPKSSVSAVATELDQFAKKE